MKKTVILSVLLGMTAAPAFAAGGSGFYGSLRAGGQSTKNVQGVFYAPAGDFTPDNGEEDEGGMQPTAVSVPAGSDTVAGRFRTKAGLQLGAELGYDFGLIRAGLDIAYGTNKVKGFAVDSWNGAALTELPEDAAYYFCDYISDGEISDGACTQNGAVISAASGSFAKVRQLSAMASVWVDIPTGLPVEPYVGGGLGVSGYHVKIPGDSDGKARFAWQLGAGVAYNITPGVALTADYRYRQVKGATLFEDGDYGVALGKLKTHSYGLGLRFTF